LETVIVSRENMKIPIEVVAQQFNTNGAYPPGFPDVVFT
jgi:hypothetical protein